MLVLSLSHIGNAVLQCVEKLQTVAVNAAEGANSQRSPLLCFVFFFFFFWWIFSVSVVPPLTEPAVLSTPTPQFNGRMQTSGQELWEN